jgi:hypothetical protein
MGGWSRCAGTLFLAYHWASNVVLCAFHQGIGAFLALEKTLKNETSGEKRGTGWVSMALSIW